MKWMILHPHSHQRNLTDTQITLEKYEAFFPGGMKEWSESKSVKITFWFQPTCLPTFEGGAEIRGTLIENTAYDIYCQISQKGVLSSQFNLPI